MIAAKGLGFAYHPGDPPVLADLTFSVAPGQTIVLAGANGSGKSTLLHLLAGLYAPTTGTLRVAGNESPREVEAVRRAATLVVQDPDMMILGSTVLEDLTLGLPPRDEAGRARALALAARFHLAAPEALVQTLSYGTRKKLCLAAALRDEPELLLLDEPLGGLDYPGMREIRAIVAANRAAGLTQVISTHDLEPLADLADSLLVLHRGRLALSGGPAEVFDQVARYGVRPPCSWQAGLGVRPWDEE